MEERIAKDGIIPRNVLLIVRQQDISIFYPIQFYPKNAHVNSKEKI
jgi:hypothetical protein